MNTAIENLKDLSALLRKRAPAQLVIQYTDHCNARCPQCGMRATETFQRSRLGDDDIKRIVDAAAAKGVNVLSFTGGEPLLHLNDLVRYIKYAGEAGIRFIRTGTNGFVFRDGPKDRFKARVTKIAEALGGTPLRNFWISIDSADPAAHEEMRGFPGLVAGVEKAVPILEEHGIYASANLGINRNIGGVEAAAALDGGDPETFYGYFREGFRKFYRLVIAMGFTTVNTCYPMSIDEAEAATGLEAVYAATAVDSVVRFTPAEKALLYRALLDTIPEFRSRIRIFSPLCSLHGLVKQHGGIGELSYPCRGGIDFFFVDSQGGDTFPCGYRGHDNLGKFWNLDVGAITNDPDCYRCDWECFRDPSELFGPILEFLHNPAGVWERLSKDSEFRRLWWEDLRYYAACEYYDGRRPPDYAKLARFAR